jgi:F-type H+-transporting ATPase subunit gamma
MSALADTEARLSSIGKLRTVVSAMSGIAAAHSQQARALLAGFEAYAGVVAEGLAEAVSLAAAEGKPDGEARGRAVVVFGAEHGFAGDFSGRVLARAGHDPADALFLVGARAQAAAEQRRIPVAWRAPMASQASGLAATARAVADGLYEGVLAGRFARADVVFARPTGGGYEVIRRSILPLDLAALKVRPRAAAPLLNLPAGRLLEGLVGEYVFAELALAALDSFASENAARLATMQSARFNIDRKLEALTGLERSLRQEEITAEVQEIVAGALTSEAGAASRY